MINSACAVARPAYGDKRVCESAGSRDRVRLLTDARGDACLTTRAIVGPPMPDDSFDGGARQASPSLTAAPT